MTSADTCLCCSGTLHSLWEMIMSETAPYLSLLLILVLSHRFLFSCCSRIFCIVHFISLSYFLLPGLTQIMIALFQQQHLPQCIGFMLLHNHFISHTIFIAVTWEAWYESIDFAFNIFDMVWYWTESSAMDFCCTVTCTSKFFLKIWVCHLHSWINWIFPCRGVVKTAKASSFAMILEHCSASCATVALVWMSCFWRKVALYDSIVDSKKILHHHQRQRSSTNLGGSRRIFVYDYVTFRLKVLRAGHMCRKDHVHSRPQSQISSFANYYC